MAHGDLRAVMPTPLDEVRTALAIFDETLFTRRPPALRARVDRGARRGRRRRRGRAALASDARADGTGTRSPRRRRRSALGLVDRRRPRRPPGRHGATSRSTLPLHADHLLRGYEAVARRLMQTIAARVAHDRCDRALGIALAQDAEELPETMRQLRRRFPEEPYRQRLGRDRGAHPADAGGAHRRDRRRGRAATRTPTPLDVELAVVQEALAADGLGRVAYGELADLRWQLGDVRVPPRFARGPPARGRPPGGDRGARRRGGPGGELVAAA